MRTRYENLTKLQVEGLSETLDFLRNGYVLRHDGNIGYCYWFMLFHRSNGSKIRVYLYQSSLVIKKDGKEVKHVDRRLDGRYYSVQVDSQYNLHLDAISGDDIKQLVLGSDLPNSDVE